MPRVREGYRQFASQLPTELLADIERLAAQNGRSVIEEIIHALRRHLVTPPTVSVVVDDPELPVATIDAPSEQSLHRKPRGRPRKAPAVPQESAHEQPPVPDAASKPKKRGQSQKQEKEATDVDL